MVVYTIDDLIYGLILFITTVQGKELKQTDRKKHLISFFRDLLEHKEELVDQAETDKRENEDPVDHLVVQESVDCLAMTDLVDPQVILFSSFLSYFSMQHN